MFRSFPSGWPGFGLLLLRTVVGVTAMVHALKAVDSGPLSPAAWSVAALTAVVGAAVTAGLFSSIAAALLGLGAIGVAFGWIPWCPSRPIDAGTSTIFFVSMCAAIATLGPGAVSIDARRRGRREIVIPEVPRNKKEMSDEPTQ